MGATAESEIIHLIRQLDKRAARTIAEIIDKYTAGVQVIDPRPFEIKEIRQYEDRYYILTHEFGNYITFDKETFDAAFKKIDVIPSNR